MHGAHTMLYGGLEQATAILQGEHDTYLDRAYLFPSPKTGTMRRLRKKLLQRAEVEENVRFPDLRRTFTTLMIQNGADSKMFSVMLSHYSAAFKLHAYSNVKYICKLRKMASYTAMLVVSGK